MKKLITTLVVSAFALFGTAVESHARPHHGDRGYSQSSSHVYVSGYRHGRPVYTQRYVAGYDCNGYPVYRYRTVSASRRGHRDHCNTGYNRGYSRSNYSHYDNHRRSGTRVSFSYRR